MHLLLSLLSRKCKSRASELERACHLCSSISGLVVEYIVAIDVTRVRFPADACPAQPSSSDAVRPNVKSPLAS